MKYFNFPWDANLVMFPPYIYQISTVSNSICYWIFNSWQLLCHKIWIKFNESSISCRFHHEFIDQYDSCKKKYLIPFLKVQKLKVINSDVNVNLFLSHTTDLDSNGFEELWVPEGKFHHFFDLSQLFTTTTNIIISNLIQSFLFFL